MAFMMLDEDVVAVSPASVYRVLSAAGLLDRWSQKPSKKPQFIARGFKEFVRVAGMTKMVTYR
jgi:hypothetical protein